MEAIIELGGTQHKISPGKIITVNRLKEEPGKEIILEKILWIKDGEKSTIGQPYVKGAQAVAEVIKNYRGKKIISFKRRPKKGYKRKIGHRQELTQLKIKEIKI